MDATRSRISPLVLLLALALVVAVAWAGSALAAGGSSSSSDGSPDAPAAGQTQIQDDGTVPNGDDCPDRAGDSADDADSAAF
jgi:hypothetical protein